ncbi:hypothetical protein L6452_11603 [Arctium lappa]|uniref:Uncharacterized protein n=1 Tax=Arctium lappa TaxID=4217 RepID=A0ACB9DQC4_ARCLA|nr:hypothetical protein L6452_11603 [Arctium lappa]
MANFQNHIPSEGNHRVLREEADAEAFIEEFCRECAAFVLDEPIPSTIFKTATNGLVGGKTTNAGGSGGHGYEVVKTDNNPALLMTTSTISDLKEPWQYELEDDHVNGCKGTGVFIPRGTAICMQKSNPIKDIAAFSQPGLADPYYDEKMKG